MWFRFLLDVCFIGLCVYIYEHKWMCMYRVLILCDKDGLSLLTATQTCMWAVSWVGYIKTVNEPTMSGNQQLSDKIITLYLGMWIDVLHSSYTNTIITLFSALTWCQTFKIPAVLYVCYTRSYEVDSNSVQLFFQLFSKMPFTLLKEKPNFTNRLYSGPEISSTLYMWLSLNATIVWNGSFKYIFII